MSELVTVYTVFGTAEEAERIARTLVEERLAACANILAPCHSLYRWEGRIEEAQEVPALFKTSAGRAERLIARLAELHSYDVPAAVGWQADFAHGPYRDWVAAETEAP